MRRSTVFASRIALVAAVTVITFLAFTDREFPVIVSVNDKVTHVLAFGALALLSDFSFPEKGFGRAIVLWLMGYALFIEVVQYFLPHRYASGLDLIADAIGIAAYGLLIPILKKVPLLRRRWEANATG